MASPTTVIVVTFSRSTILQIAAGSNLREEARTSVLPWWKQMKAAGHDVTYWQQNETRKWERKG